MSLRPPTTDRVAMKPGPECSHTITVPVSPTTLTSVKHPSLVQSPSNEMLDWMLWTPVPTFSTQLQVAGDAGAGAGAGAGAVAPSMPSSAICSQRDNDAFAVGDSVGSSKNLRESPHPQRLQSPRSQHRVAIWPCAGTC
jgi:hypothetical protein